MTTSSNIDPNQFEDHDTESLDQSRQDENSIDLSQDPEFIQLLEHFQNAEFDQCQSMLRKLEQSYPNHPELLRFREDLDLRSSAKTLKEKIEDEEKRTVRKKRKNLVIFAVVGVLIVVSAFLITYFVLLGRYRDSQAAAVAPQLISMNEQAEQYLEVGKPQLATEIIDQISALDPNYENLSSLSTRTAELLVLEEKYLTALDLAAEGEDAEAVILFKEIEAEKPGMWDVSQQLAMINTEQQVKDLLTDGHEAFQIENWAQVINAYEKALEVNPQLDDPLIKEQLLLGYFNRIIQLLQYEDTSFDVVETADQYYLKALTLVPGDEELSGEALSLQEMCSGLLVSKLTEAANTILGGNTQTASSIETAASYMNRAANLEPGDAALQLNLENTTNYQLAFQSCIDAEWSSAITSLEQILGSDPNFANGNADRLLYEAYFSLGKQYFSQGLFQDAINNFEKAEFMAWEDPDNQLKLFQAQVILGDIFGEMNYFENAVLYYEYALRVIHFPQRLEGQTDINESYSEALSLVANGSYEDAFNHFQEVIEGIDFIYTVSEVEISDGACLAVFADANQSTLDAILIENDLPNTTILSDGRTLKVPKLN